MKLAKPCIDVGLQTNNKEALLAFWQEEAGLAYEELLKVGGGTHQHRLELNGSVFKLNHLRDELPDGDNTGYFEILIARDGLQTPVRLTDPDGNHLSLVPRGESGVDQLGIRIKVRSIEVFRDFYTRILGLEEIEPAVFRWGATLIFLSEDKNKQPTHDLRGKGYRYLTVQVFDVDREHDTILKRGGIEGRPPMSLGETARISFIKDPDGNWIEISQRASLTGKIPQ